MSLWLKEIYPTSKPGHVTAMQCCKNALRNVAKMPYMLRKCPKMLQECPMVAKGVARMPYSCENALNMLRKCPNFTMHIVIIIIVIIVGFIIILLHFLSLSL